MERSELVRFVQERGEAEARNILSSVDNLLVTSYLPDTGIDVDVTDLLPSGLQSNILTMAVSWLVQHYEDQGYSVSSANLDGRILLRFA